MRVTPHRFSIVLLVLAGLVLTTSPSVRAAPPPARPAAWDNPTLSPQANSRYADASTKVSIAYSEAIAFASVNADTFVVHGMQTGKMTGNYVVNGWQAHYEPLRYFYPGELVYVTATRNILNTNGQSAPAPTTWEFRTKPTAGPATLEFAREMDAGTVWSIEAGDLNGDGRPDLYLGRAGTDQIWLGQGHGAFSQTNQALGNAESRTMDAVLGDLDNDGDLDAFAIRSAGAVPIPVKIWINDGTGVFHEGTGFNPGANAFSAALADLDGDGDLDVFMGTSSGGQVWLNQGGTQGGIAATFSQNGNTLGSAFIYSVALGDVDGDHDFDAFAAVGYHQGNQVWLNDGAGNFTDSGQRPGSDFSTTVALGDFDGDHAVDAFVGNSFDTTSPDRIYMNDGSGVFTAKFQTLGSNGTPASVVGDFEGDGDLDIYTGEDGGKVWVNDGYSNFSAYAGTLASQPADALALGDFYANGHQDLVLESNTVQVYESGYVAPRTCPLSCELDTCWIKCLAKCTTPSLAMSPQQYNAVDENVFYPVRDQILATTPQGQHYIQTYYAHDAEILQLLIANAALWDDAVAVTEQWQPNLAALVNGTGDLTTITSAQVQALDNFLTALSTVASSELQQTITDERAALGSLENFVGMTMTQARSQVVGTGAQLPHVTKSGDTHSTIAVTNLSGSAINALLELFDVSGNNVHTANQLIPANGAVNFTLPDSVGTHFNGAARVSSTDTLVALLQNANANQHARDVLQSTTVPSTTLAIPVLRNRGSDTDKSIVTIQNTSEISPTQVTLHYRNANGTEAGSDTQTIAPRGSYAFDSFALFGASKVTYHARAESETYIVGSLQIVSNQDSAALRAPGDADTGTSLVIPFVERTIKNGAPNNWSEIFVQNRGSTATKLTLAFYTAKGVKIAKQSKTLASNGSIVLDTRKVKNMGDKFTGYAVVTQDGVAPLAAAILETNTQGKRLFAFAGAPLIQATSAWSCADTRRAALPKQATRFKVVNPTASASEVAVDLYASGTGALLVTKTFQVAGHQQLTVNLSKAMFAAAGDNFSGLARVRSINKVNVVVASYATYAGGGTTGNTCEPLP